MLCRPGSFCSASLPITGTRLCLSVPPLCLTKMARLGALTPLTGRPLAPHWRPARRPLAPHCPPTGLPLAARWPPLQVTSCPYWPPLAACWPPPPLQVACWNAEVGLVLEPCSAEKGTQKEEGEAASGAAAGKAGRAGKAGKAGPAASGAGGKKGGASAEGGLYRLCPEAIAEVVYSKVGGAQVVLVLHASSCVYGTAGMVLRTRGAVCRGSGNACMPVRAGRAALRLCSSADSAVTTKGQTGVVMCQLHVHLYGVGGPEGAHPACTDAPPCPTGGQPVRH